MISETALREFKKMYVEEFGEDISDEQATKLATNLLTLFNYTFKPIKKEWLSAISEKEKPYKT